MDGYIRDRYEPIEVVGRGENGEVIRALDQHLQREVALKVRDIAGDEERELLLKEGRSLFGVGPHPSLAILRDHFVDDNRYYLVADWVEGETLEELAAGAGLVPSRALRYLDEIAGVLAHLHTHDVVHGDVKPSNLVVDSHDRCLLVDFGFVRSTGQTGGPYTAPELETEPAPASDTYALAATAVFAVTGEPPTAARLTDPVSVEWVVRDGLTDDPAKRLHSPRDVVDRLRSWVAEDLPTGTVTFLLTDVEGSTRMLGENPKAGEQILGRERVICTELVERHEGKLPRDQGEGDSALAVFARATDAVACAIDLQRAHFAEPWPGGADVRIRIALHTGEAELVDGGYRGININRCARIRSLALGGQTFLSRSTADLVQDRLPQGASLRDIGFHNLKDLERAEQLYQLRHPDLPDEIPVPTPSGGRKPSVGQSYLEVWKSSGPELFPLPSERCTAGRAEDCDLVLEGDTISRLHASFEPYGQGWCIRDLGSRSGTTVNGQPVMGDRPLHDRDEIRLGELRLIFRSGTKAAGITQTKALDPPPELTATEKKVLVELYRPIFKGDAFTPPATVKEIAKALVVSESAVKQHLSRLYDKFGIHEGERRILLTGEAMRRGAISFSDLRGQD